MPQPPAANSRTEGWHRLVYTGLIPIVIRAHLEKGQINQRQGSQQLKGSVTVPFTSRGGPHSSRGGWWLRKCKSAFLPEFLPSSSLCFAYFQQNQLLCSAAAAVPGVSISAAPGFLLGGALLTPGWAPACARRLQPLSWSPGPGNPGQLRRRAVRKPPLVAGNGCPRLEAVMWRT